MSTLGLHHHLTGFIEEIDSHNRSNRSLSSEYHRNRFLPAVMCMARNENQSTLVLRQARRNGSDMRRWVEVAGGAHEKLKEGQKTILP
ncbi:hypothetical protein E3N88_20932 [Mikania micrantha]|uniref:Uncharacterized protein n=1 Tax=Mikania micrantha TaxID=192012 RepID=A0A5N6NJU1_9ASTR|nr:hypothetical protein E3N88_20932 [Mikania micrantha]